MRIFSCLHRIVDDQSGATAIEYCLIATLISIAAISVMATIGTDLSSTFNTVAGLL
jgi:pilus assembly protein Flp/PilA